MKNNVILWKDAVERKRRLSEPHDLTCWMVTKTFPGATHFVGYDATSNRSVMPEITSYNPITRVGVSPDGTAYLLCGDSGVDSVALYDFTKWCTLESIVSFRDVTNEYEV